MEPNDLTIRILQEIRDEQRATRIELKEEIHQVREELHLMNDRFEARFEVIETTLRDLAQQMVLLARGIKTALEVRS